MSHKTCNNFRGFGAPYGRALRPAFQRVSGWWGSFRLRRVSRGYGERGPTGATALFAPPVSTRMRRPSAVLGMLTGGAIAAAAALWQPGIRVVDGDTVDHGFWRWRIVGIDTPETGSRARCPEERVLGQAAKLRLAEAMRNETAVLAPAEAIWKRDPWGRRLARLHVGGRDVAEILIAEGLARPYAGGKRGTWCPAR